ncbi:hypothetical protein [Bradyrhizobium sp.]
MRTTPAAAAAKPVSVPSGGWSYSPTELVCAALALALLVLACRIASVWW